MNLDGLFQQLPSLVTERLLLRPLALDDAAAMFAYASDPEVARYVTWPAHQTIDDTLVFLRLVIDDYAADRVAPWGIVLRATDELIGTSGFVDWRPSHRRPELGYALARSHWGCGYMTEAVGAVISFGFDHMALNRIEALCEPPNLGSARVMEKLGMSYEGLLRSYLCCRGCCRDLKIYSILRQWPYFHLMVHPTGIVSCVMGGTPASTASRALRNRCVLTS